MADVTQRVLALLATLQTGRAFSGDELAGRLDTSPRTLRRDIERLRGYGYPVETQPGPGGFYRLARGAVMPPLLLDDDEAVAAMLGLATLAAAGSAGSGSVDDAAARAYGKLDQFLPRRLRHQAAALRSALETGRTPGPSTNAATMSLLAGAIAGRHLVTFGYAGATGAATVRRVEPYRQIHFRLRWYLLAFDTGRDDWRVFRIDRIAEPRDTGRPYAERPLPARTGLDYLREGLGKDGQRVEFTVHAPMLAVADALRHHEADLTALDGDRTHAVVVVDAWQWLLPGLAFLDAEIVIHGPAEVRAAWQRFAARLRPGGG
ncbi:helix-turn-helix transcriptional regulator [Actinoplanes aureus]|uniref:WYL domain-containing protein n=1 Tax=Actinoplanes aureus TaxID=2792083 RepID=A0A931G1N0_9ACTN|nr:WYL domain-containing protein [Actinoplanes aureus]MBG0562499.1 WYL domain-containing protein [Actinoplanes aureus]